MALRDTRHIKFNDSLLGTIESSLSCGLVHFNYFPNFTVGLHDPHIMKALILNIKTHGTLMLPGFQQIALIYGVYYKCIRTNLNVQALDKRIDTRNHFYPNQGCQIQDPGSENPEMVRCHLPFKLDSRK